ncbi:MAG: ABC transporter ATP-binding protein [Kiritimatiellae bacterium]|nr:ABC transporter ATP-binding protein [Kiritimatiellia bacterium]
MKKKVEYRREFFDRDYAAKEAYGRLSQFARRYRLRLVVGVVCGMLTAGTLLPLFQLMQPALEKVERSGATQVAVHAENPAAVPVASQKPTRQADGDVGKKARKLEKEYGKLRKAAAKLGFDMQDENEALGLPLLAAIVFVVPLVALLRCVLVFLNHYCLAWVGMRTVKDIRCELFSHIARQSMQFHGRIDVGQLMSRCTSDPTQVQQIIQTVLQEIAQAPFEILVSVSFIVWTAVSNGMLSTLSFIVVGFPMFMVPVVMLSKRIRKWSKRALERLSVVGGRIHELLTCIKVVKSYDTEKYEEAKYDEANSATLKATLKSLRWGLLVGPAVETVGILLLCAFFVWCFATHVKISVIIPMLAPLLLIYRPVKQLSRLQVQVEQGRAALGRIWSVLDVDMTLPEAVEPVVKSTFDDKVEFRNVTFRYDTAEHDAVKGASFEIPRGKMVAVVGGTGSGKTTTAGLLARFFDPQKGEILMDGVDLRRMRASDLRRLVGAVTQEALLFNDTIEANIRYGSENATHDEVVAAAKLANAHDFIMSQPGGYSRMVGEKGFSLSGGERQRIAIARAILRNPPILILDEATSALDTVTERLVQDALSNLMKNRTTFAIAHRLSTIRDADTILVMQDGEIVERGTHDELYAADGIYRRLCDMQRQS